MTQEPLKMQYLTLEENIERIENSEVITLDSPESISRLVEWLKELVALRAYLHRNELSYGDLRREIDVF